MSAKRLQHDQPGPAAAEAHQMAFYRRAEPVAGTQDDQVMKVSPRKSRYWAAVPAAGESDEERGDSWHTGIMGTLRPARRHPPLCPEGQKPRPIIVL